MIDFSKLGLANSANTALHPRQLFNALPNNVYQYPRDVQTEVWNAWFDSRNDRQDSVIKMNTGSGKTIIGLLILKSCLNEGLGPAVYLCPDNFLAQQVRSEAIKLGLDVTDEISSLRFQASDSILVTNIYKLINGQSKFGVGQVDVTIGSLVIDDVHACLIDTEQQFTLTFGRDMVEGTLDLFGEDLKKQSPGSFHAIKNGDSLRELLIPYWAWQRDIEKVRELVTTNLDSQYAKFKWPLVDDVLKLADCFVSGNSVEISLRNLPIDVIPSFEEAERRIFMSATISDDSILISHFDAKVNAGENSITPETAGDTGDRLILIPQYLTPAITDQEIREMASRYAKDNNVVVVVPSRQRYSYWEPYADQLLDSSSLASGVERLKQGYVGLSVLLNKYDGVDLPDDACRLLIIDDLPDARRSLDKHDQVVLHGSGLELTQPMQRIEQGMGRGVRSSKDYCAVLLMGNKLTNQIVGTGGIHKFTASTRVQYELSQQLNDQLTDKGIAGIEGAIDQFLARDSAWLQASKSRLSDVKYNSVISIRDEVVKQRTAFTSTRQGDADSGVNHIRSAVRSSNSDRLEGLLLQEQAKLQNLLDRETAQSLQRAAIKKNKHLLKPIEGTVYQKLNPASKQGNVVFQRLKSDYEDVRTLPIFANSLISELQFGTDYKDFERAVQRLGYLLGFESHRPDSEYGTGPDNLWRTQNNIFFAIECKSESNASFISKSDCDQVSGHVNWTKKQYGKEITCIPVIIHPSKMVCQKASPLPDMKVITEVELSAIRIAIHDFILAIVSNWAELTNDLVAQQLNSHHLSASQFSQKYLTKHRKQPK